MCCCSPSTNLHPSDMDFLLLHRRHFQCSSTWLCLLNRSRNRPRSPATCLLRFTSCLFKPMPTARLVVSSHSSDNKNTLQHAEYWGAFKDTFSLCCFRQESKRLHQRGCGRGQGSVQASRWFPGYHYDNMWFFLTTQSTITVPCAEIRLRGNNRMCCVHLQMTRAIQMLRRSRRKRSVINLIIMHLYTLGLGNISRI